MDTVVNGQIVRIPNSARKAFSTASKEYLAVWFDQYDGKDDRCYMFTDAELRPFVHVDLQGLKLVQGRLYPLVQGDRKAYLTQVVQDGVTYQFKLSDFSVKRAKERAIRNPEDCTRRSLWARLTS